MEKIKLKNVLKIKKNLENQLTQINAQIFELQSGLNLEPIRELQQFSSNDSTLESIQDELLITLKDSDINQFLKTFA
jgi:competence protein ComGF